MKRSILRAGFLSVLLSAMTSQLIAADDETRVVAGISSADALIEDLKHIVVNLADREDSFENNIFPNIDIFLIGVDTTLPVRFDPVFSDAHGMELQPLIPFVDLDEFLQDNLDPIGIIPKRVRADRDLYELTGNVFEGWLRVLKGPDYVAIAPRKESIPKGMAHPAAMHAELVKAGYLFFAELDNTRSNAEAREVAFQKMRTNAIEGIQKKPSESQNAFDLRKAALDHQLSILQQWFVESQNVSVGSKLDREKNLLLSELFFSATDETTLQKNISRVRSEPSYFTAIEENSDALLQLRLNFKFEEEIANGFREIYKLSDVVAKELIEEDEEATAEQKASRLKISKLMNEVLSKSAALGKVDGFLDIVPTEKAHLFVMGVRCEGQEQILSAIEELPVNREGWKLEKDVAESEGVKIHKFDLGGEAPKALAELYGESSGTIYLAVSEKAFWLAFGAEAQNELVQRIKAVRTAENIESDNLVMSLTAKVGPLTKSLNALLNDENSVLGSFITQRQQKREKEKEAEKEEEGEERAARQAASAFMSFEWIEKVIGTMDGADDTLHLELKADKDNSLVGKGEAREGILKAVGTLIANFADENLQ